jgi:hypothetical protein
MKHQVCRHAISEDPMPTSSLSDQIHSIPSISGTDQDRMLQIEALRRDLAAVVDDAKRIVASQVAQAGATVEHVANDSVDVVRETIRAHPMAAIAAAVVVGAALAVVLTPAAPRKMASRGGWVPSALTATHVQEMISNAQSSAVNSTAGSSLASALERVVESVSSIDPKASLTPALEKAGAWLGSLRSAWMKT